MECRKAPDAFQKNQNCVSVIAMSVCSQRVADKHSLDTLHHHAKEKKKWVKF